MFLEPTLGEGGVVPAPDGYLKAARDACDAAGALLVLDEIQSGIGRTGAWFAHQREGVLPDVITLAKGLGGGLPIGACIGIGRFGSVLGKGDHGSTFGGNPIACAAALAVLDTIERDGLLAHVTSVGAHLAAGIEGIKHPLVTGVRGSRAVAGDRAHRPGRDRSGGDGPAARVPGQRGPAGRGPAGAAAHLVRRRGRLIRRRAARRYSTRPASSWPGRSRRDQPGADAMTVPVTTAATGSAPARRPAGSGTSCVTTTCRRPSRPSVLALAAQLKADRFASQAAGRPARGRGAVRQAVAAHQGVVRGRHRRARRLPAGHRRAGHARRPGRVDPGHDQGAGQPGRRDRVAHLRAGPDRGDGGEPAACRSSTR